MKLSVCLSIGAGLLLLAGDALAQDVLKASPGTNKVLLENQYVRVLQSTFKPGAKEPMHTHPAGWYYVTRAGTLKVTYASGKVEMWTPKVGEQAWMDGEEPHSAENTGKTTLQYLLVEVKAAPTKTPN
ncbi:MAG TPA: cupin domain-containing protein [Steroidobacteraceae bacterium]|nr:cupin domain-containing protein [Steroidobacteraceae bacterium]